jgi:TPR repeat protein
VKQSLIQRWFGSAAPTPIQETTETLAQGGSAEAQFSLGVKYANGAGTAQDYAQAEVWYLKAAGQNHALAHLNLGVMYASGQGQPADAAKSLVWIQKAAELGDASAQFRLGELNHRDVRSGVSPVGGQSRIDAYKWYRLAANQGYRGAEVACETVNLDMSREEVTEATRRVADFNAKGARQTPAGE